MAIPGLNALSDEELRGLLRKASLDDLFGAHRDFLRMMGDDSRIFYCPTCDKMVTIVKPIRHFCPAPWRADVFKFKTKVT